MTFSPNPTKFHTMIQSEGLSANIKVNGVLAFGYMRLSQRQVWGIVYFWELLQLPAELLKSLWMHNETALHVGQKKKEKNRCQDTKTHVAEKSELYGLSKMKRNKPRSHQQLTRSCALSFEVVYHLSFLCWKNTKKEAPPYSYAQTVCRLQR